LGHTLRYDRNEHAVVDSSGNITKYGSPQYKEAIARILSRVSDRFLGINEGNQEAAACLSVLMSLPLPIE
jgi:hypothetical protein